MTTLLIHNATCIATFDHADPCAGAGTEERIALRARPPHRMDRARRGTAAALRKEADAVIDARGMVVLPGLVNCHHHLYQTLTRGVPAAQDATLFRWLKTLYPIWAGLTSEVVYTSALVGLAELVLSGCTTASDHLYIYPNDCRIDDEIRAAVAARRALSALPWQR